MKAVIYSELVSTECLDSWTHVEFGYALEGPGEEKCAMMMILLSLFMKARFKCIM